MVSGRSSRRPVKRCRTVVVGGDGGLDGVLFDSVKPGELNVTILPDGTSMSDRALQIGCGAGARKAPIRAADFQPTNCMVGQVAGRRRRHRWVLNHWSSTRQLAVPFLQLGLHLRRRASLGGAPVTL
jgi:hypothetical protein